ncbi:MAG: hypothetical protein L3K10_07895 [Thermoplasmata archaeon]|nr:hypothetical protein [Thermoplasmata archaeon]
MAARRSSRTRAIPRDAPPRLEWPRTLARTGSAPGTIRYRQLQLELDVAHEGYRSEPFPILAPFASFFHEREVEGVDDLLQMTARALEAFSRSGFREVDHWEVRPGGWLPLPEPAHERLAEPVTHLLRAFLDASWAPVRTSRTFAARLTGPGGTRLDFTLRRVHRERTHALSVMAWGPITRGAANELVARVHERLPLVRAEVASALPVGGALGRAGTLRRLVHARR